MPSPDNNSETRAVEPSAELCADVAITLKLQHFGGEQFAIGTEAAVGAQCLDLTKRALEGAADGWWPTRRMSD